MKTFTMNNNEESYRHHAQTVAVVNSFIEQQLQGFQPQFASLSGASFHKTVFQHTAQQHTLLEHITHAHYDDNAQNLEGIARLLWAAVPLASESPELLNQLQQAVVNGINPQHRAFWGAVTDYNQRCVEMAAIAMAMVEQKALFFDVMNSAQRQHLMVWLRASTDIKIPNNNWHLFRVLILMALRHVGTSSDIEVLLSDLDQIDQMYVGEGWYGDGPRGCTDYYNAFAFHYYGLLFARWCALTVDEHSNALTHYATRFIERSALFAKSFALWIGADGAPIAYGRSMTYRFASAGIWSELAHYPQVLAEVGLCVAEMKTYWATSLRWWSQQPILSEGLLSVGYRYPNLIVSEFYNSPMSPLLALKGFAAIALSPTHPFWQAQERTIPANVPPIMLCENKQIVTRHQGVSRLLSGAPSAAELRNSHDKYLKLAYSSAHGFCVESLCWIEQGFIGDNLVACRHPTLNSWHFRTALLSSEIVENTLITCWQPFVGCTVKTTQWFDNGVECRRHTVNCQQTVEFIMSGYAVDAWVACMGGDEYRNSSAICGTEMRSQLILQTGQGRYGLMPCAPNSNLLFSQAAVPVIYGQFPTGISEWEIEVISEKIQMAGSGRYSS